MTLDGLLEAQGLKALPRAGWVRKGVLSPESVAAHSWGVSLLVLALLPDGLDVGRALAYAALHDLPEVRTGDVTPADGVSKEEKARREHEAMRALCATLPNGARLLATWEAYEAQADPEARFVRQLDRVDMALQATVYAKGGAVGMDEFVASARRFITDPALTAVLSELTADS